MIFARPEDGAFNPNNDEQYFFVTTGEGTGNALGRLYSLELDRHDPTGPAKLTVSTTPTRSSRPAATSRSARTTSTSAATT